MIEAPSIGSFQEKRRTLEYLQRKKIRELNEE